MYTYIKEYYYMNKSQSVIPGVLTAIGALIYFAYPITNAQFIHCELCINLSFLLIIN